MSGSIARVSMGVWLARAIESGLPPAQRAVLAPILGLASFFYDASTRSRNFLYDRGMLALERIPARVVCVGNLTVGGTGKTPVVIEVARVLAARGAKIAVVSRGYGGRGGKGRGRAIVASDGGRALVDPSESGDEPAVLAARLPGVPVVVGADRVAAGRLAIERFAPQVILLDDGFQHRRLARDLDLVTWDARESLAKARLLPSGRLREHPRGVRRAGMILVKCTGREEGSARELIDGLRALAPLAPVFRFRLAPQSLTDGEGEEVPNDWLEGRRVLAVSGIARPDSFTALLSSLGANIVGERAFPDHHPFGPADLAAIRRAAAGGAQAIVTTEKDLVRLAGFQAEVPCLALRVRAEIEDPEGFERELVARVLGAPRPEAEG